MASIRGYSTGFVRAVNSADPKLIGVQLARICIKKNIPVTDVAEYLGVSRQSIYMWFVGRTRPHPNTVLRLRELVKTLKAGTGEMNQ